MSGSTADNTRLTIGGHYLIDLRTSQPMLSGCPAYRAADTLAPGAALLGLAPVMPPPDFQDFAALRHPALMPIIVQDIQGGALWAICNGPPGPAALAEGFSPWRENHVIEGVVRPFAGLLQLLERTGLTARAIRPDNVFCVPGSHQLILGPLGLTPPALHQPVLFEPLSSAVCQPIGRGAGTIACDMFSLGVLILSLVLGRQPLAGLSDDEILQRRFETGSFLAYTDGHPLPSALSTLIAALLSDDPDLRPSPNDLVNVSQRTVFSTPPDIHARLPLSVGPAKVRTVRALAWHAARESTAFSALMQRRVIARWLQRELEMGGLVHAIEHVVSDMTLSSAAGLTKSSDSATPMLSRIINVLDPAAPLFLGGRWFWPEALPTMLAYAQLSHALAGRTDPNTEEHQLTSILSYLVTNGDSFQRGTPPAIARQIMALVHLARRSVARGRDRVLRLPFDENPFLPCLSPRCAKARIAQPQALLVWLDGSTLPTSEQVGQSGLLDAAMRIFFDSNIQRRAIPVLSHAQRAALPTWLADLSLLAGMQTRFGTGPLPAIAARLLPDALSRLTVWRSLSTQKTRRGQVQQAAARGDLERMIGLIEDPDALARDAAGATGAIDAIARINDALESLETQAPSAEARFRETGNFLALTSGIVAALVGCWLEFIR